MDLPASLLALRDEVDRRLTESLAALADRDGARPPAKLQQAMAHTLLAGGKRLRPLLVLESARAASEGLSEEEALELAFPAALAVEYVHTYSLIHDDLPALDDDELRRGRPTLHVLYDEATAILSGDSLLTDAFALVARAERRAAEQCLELARAAGSSGMVGGQLDDLMGEGRPVDAEGLKAIHSRKTGRLFRAASVLGALAVDAPARVQGALDRYAGHFGLAFQIADDVLDVVGDVEQRGKKQGGDVAHDKATYARAYGLDGARARAEEQAELAVKEAEALGERARNLVALARYSVGRTR